MTIESTTDKIEGSVRNFVAELERLAFSDSHDFYKLGPMEKFSKIREAFNVMDKQVEWACNDAKQQACELHKEYLNG